MSRRKNNIRAILIIITIILIAFFWFWEKAARGVDFIPSPVDIVKSNIPPSDSKWEKIADRIIVKETNSLEYRLLKEKNIEKQFDYFITNGDWFLGIIKYSSGSKLIYTPIVGKVHPSYDIFWYRRLCVEPILLAGEQVNEYLELKSKNALWTIINPNNEITKTEDFKEYFDSAVKYFSANSNPNQQLELNEYTGTYYSSLENELKIEKSPDSLFWVKAVSALARHQYNCCKKEDYDSTDKPIRVEIELLLIHDNWLATIISNNYSTDSGNYDIYIGRYDSEWNEVFVNRFNPKFRYQFTYHEMIKLKENDSLWFLIAENNFWKNKMRFLQLYEDLKYMGDGESFTSHNSNNRTTSIDSLLPVNRTIIIPIK